MTSTPGLPEDAVLVGHISGAFGVVGWVRIRPYSTDASALLGAKTWWLDKPEVHDVERLSAKLHGDEIVARLTGIADRNAAEAMKGATVHISRKHFPSLSDGEFYWVDLIGSQVHNLQGEFLGVVRDLMDNGAHPILRVASADIAEADLHRHEKLIPFVESFVKQVDLTARTIEVDWGLDY